MKISRFYWPMLSIIVALLFLCECGAQEGATVPSSPPHGQVVEIKDLSSKFLDFYEAAMKENASPDRRWELWTEKYDFAAVPPIPAGQKMARERLDTAWSKYPSAIAKLRLGASALTPSPQRRLEQVVQLLQTSAPVHIRLITFVGTFRRDAFAMGVKDGVSTIAIPLEDSDLHHALDMTHEFTHAVQIQMGQWSGQSVASAIFTEGLAMHVTEALNPGYGSDIYAASTPEWMNACKTKFPEVLSEMRDHLNDEGAQAVSKFTFAKGPAGLDRDVYCAGWIVVGNLLQSGYAYHDLAAMHRDNAAALIVKEFDKMGRSDSHRP